MSDTRASAAVTLDIEHAKPLPLPRLRFMPKSQIQQAIPNSGPPKVFPGYEGTGKMSPVRVAPAKSEDDLDKASGDFASAMFGTLNHPFTTARADLKNHTTTRYYPYRATGKIFFSDGTSTYMCSGSLIKRGVVATAAHCVAEFGTNQFYTNFQFIPGYSNGSAPYGVWTAAAALAGTSYLNGTASCAVSGIVCQNDVALLVLNPQSGAFPGTTTGYYGYGVNFSGFTTTNPTSTKPKTILVNQLGYPGGLDSGELMERTDSQGYVDTTLSNNTIIGSMMDGGSSGGPWLHNLGQRPVLSGTTYGTYALPNILIGVTSWGYIDPALKEQGASPLTTANFTDMVTFACTNYPAQCQ